MANKLFHIYNIAVLVLLLMFNLLVLLGYGIGEGKMSVGDWFPIIFSFFIWGLFYYFQFKRSSNVWRMAWFGTMVLILFFWETGLGAWIGRMIG